MKNIFVQIINLIPIILLIWFTFTEYKYWNIVQKNKNDIRVLSRKFLNYNNYRLAICVIIYVIGILTVSILEYYVALDIINKTWIDVFGILLLFLILPINRKTIVFIGDTGILYKGTSYRWESITDIEIEEDLHRSGFNKVMLVVRGTIIEGDIRTGDKNTLNQKLETYYFHK